MEADQSYAIVASQQTNHDPDWQAVVEALQAKYPQARILVTGGNLHQIAAELQQVAPRYVAFVAQPGECTRAYVSGVHRITSGWHGKPVGGCMWGIVTGHDAADALRVAKERTPLKARRMLSGCWINPASFAEGVSFSESKQGEIQFELSIIWVANRGGESGTWHVRKKIIFP